MIPMNCAETNEEVNERLNKFEKEIDSVEPDQVNARTYCISFLVFLLNLHCFSQPAAQS